ncbi:glycosyltransferase [Halocola ammonii]
MKNHFHQFNSNIFKLTSPVLDHRKRTIEKSSSVLHLGWVGDFGVNKGPLSAYCHKRSFTELLLPALKASSYPLKLTILGIRNPMDAEEIRSALKDRENIELEFPGNIDWINEDEVYERISALDVGLSPLLNHDFNKAKSAFKVKQYLSCGVPVLASPVGENCLFVTPCENGFFCNNSNDFCEGIERFHTMDSELYGKYSMNALRTKEEYSVKQFGQGLNDILDQLLLKKLSDEECGVPVNS